MERERGLYIEDEGQAGTGISGGGDSTPESGLGEEIDREDGEGLGEDLGDHEEEEAPAAEPPAGEVVDESEDHLDTWPEGTPQGVKDRFSEMSRKNRDLTQRASEFDGMKALLEDPEIAKAFQRAAYERTYGKPMVEAESGDDPNAYQTPEDLQAIIDGQHENDNELALAKVLDVALRELHDSKRSTESDRQASAQRQQQAVLDEVTTKFESTVEALEKETGVKLAPRMLDVLAEHATALATAQARLAKVGLGEELSVEDAVRAAYPLVTKDLVKKIKVGENVKRAIAGTRPAPVRGVTKPAAGESLSEDEIFEKNYQKAFGNR